MKLTRGLLAAALIFSTAFISFFAVAVQPVYGQDTRIALQRGYRTGYSDGYMSGYRDSIDNLAKDAAKHKEYVSADRAYNQEYGTLEDYRDGYRQGFESGYNTGFDKLSFESTVPSSLARRGLSEIQPVVPENAPETAVAEPIAAIATTASEPAAEPIVSEPEPIAAEPVAAAPAGGSEPPTEATAAAAEPAAETPSAGVIQQANYTNDDEPIIIIPRDTELIVEIQEELSTDGNRDGDKFTAKIVSPVEIAGATIEGRIDRIQKPGRIKRRSQLELSFDRIILNERRWSNFDAILTEVLPVKGDNVKLVDNEGTAIGKRDYKGDGIKIGASTGAGAGIGAITAGPVGAAVGASVGAAFGVGAVIIERGKHIRLNRNQQLRIKASYETKIR